MSTLSVRATVAGILAGLCSSAAMAGTVTVPHTFSAGTPARAAEVNANFSAIATGVNGNAADITSLKSAVQVLQDSGFVFRGPWTTTTNYDLNEIVTKDGSSFIATAKSTGVDPVADVAGSGGKWALLAQKGANGTNGSIGPQGPQGFPGATGAAGPAGPAGPQGIPGPMGPAGATGDTGPQGPQGLQGPKGDTGATGPVGATGATGPQGPQGLQGATGPIGPQGLQGLSGATGAVGPAGPAGPQGIPGPMGPAGPAGLQGDAGPIGPAGSIGPAGPMGPMGPEGPQGLEGPQGPPGESGVVGAGVATTDLSSVGIPILIDPASGTLGTASATGVYKPTVINVTCDGTGTPLSDTLARLNPTAAVYEIVISGICNEQIRVKNFASLTLRPAEGAAASIGPLWVDNGNAMILVDGLQIRWDGQTSGGFLAAVMKPSTGRLDLRNVEIVCEPGSRCMYAVQMQGAGDLRLYGGALSGDFWGNGRVDANRGGTVIVAQVTSGDCLPFGSYLARFGATIRVVANNGHCAASPVNPTGILSYMGATVILEGSAAYVGVDAQGGQVYVPTDALVSSVACKGAAAVVERADYSGNLCP